MRDGIRLDLMRRGLLRLAPTPEAVLGSLAPALDGDVKHRHQEDADRARGEHAAEHRRADCTTADFRGAGRDHHIRKRAGRPPGDDDPAGAQ